VQEYNQVCGAGGLPALRRKEEAMPSRTHRPWQPRMGDDHLFNPFVRSTDPGVKLDDTRELADVEAEEELAEIHGQKQAEITGEKP
jgi:hypothetical protein